MTDTPPQRPNALKKSDPEKYARLLAESKAPYRGLRKFLYVTFGLSGAIGGFVFLFRVLAGRNLETTLPNLALQIGVVVLMIGLFRWDKSR